MDNGVKLEQGDASGTDAQRSSNMDLTVKRQQLDQLYRQLPQGLIANVINASLVAWILSTPGNELYCRIWLVAMIAVSAARWVTCSRFRNQDIETVSYHDWRRTFAIGAFVTGALWGIAGSFLLSTGDISRQAFLGFVLGGMTAGASASMSSHNKIYTIYAGLVVIPFAIRMLAEGQHMTIAMGLMSFAFTALLAVTARRNTAALIESIRLRLENADLIKDLSAQAEELARSNDALKTENLQRQDTEKALLQAKSDAEAAVRAKAQFLANMSHEIRTPMNGVFGMTDLLMRTNLDDRQTKLVKTVNESAKSLLTIINDILDLSRIEAGKLELDCHEFNVRELMERSVDLFAGQAHSKGLELTLFLDRELPAFLRGDSARLKQVLLNIIGNALKFTSRGDVAVRVTCQERSAKTAGITIEIHDTGIGIDNVTATKLFQPFSQGETSISRRYGGTGLGLSISRHLIELMGGKIALDSELGRGTRVTINLTLETATTAFEGYNDYGALDGARIIVIDDRETNRDIMINYLDGCGSKTARASSTAEAWPMIVAAAESGKPFHAAIVDMIMPDENGLDFARRIKADEKLSAIKIILATSLDWQGDVTTIREAGIETVLHKPIRRHELIESAARAISGARHPGWTSSSPLATAKHVSANADAPRKKLSANVLLAEDNPVNVEVAKEFLAGLGCRVFVVNNGLGAVAAIASSPYDLILMDCQMPIMDGLTATRRIRAIEMEGGSVRVPIIAVTANAFAEDRARCLEAGMDDYLSKPYSEKALYDALAKWLSAPAERAFARRTAKASYEASTATLEASGPVARTVEQQTSAPSSGAPALDASVIAPLRQARPDLLRRLINTYLSYAPKAIEDLNSASEKLDFDQLKALAHSLKSSSANLGASTIAACSRQLERIAAEKQAEESQKLVAEITAGFSELQAALEKEITALPPAPDKAKAAS